MYPTFAAPCIALLLLAALNPVHAAPESPDSTKAVTVAEDFINSYIQAIPSFDGYMGAVAWVKGHALASPNFKKRLENLYRKALREDPELGYGADAVLGGQDHPEQYKVQSVRIEGDRALVDLIGKEPIPLKLRMILTRHNNSWMVEASGDLVE